MSEIATSLHLSQPAMTKMINRMSDKGYLDVNRDESDNRKKSIRLSPRALERLPDFERIWESGHGAHER